MRLLPNLRPSIAALAFALLSLPAAAAVVIDVSETAGDTTFLFQGTLQTNTATIIAPSTSFDVANVFAPNSQIASMPDLVPIDLFSVTGPASPFAAATVLPFNATSRTGDLFAITGSDLALAQTYASGSFLSGSLVFQGATFADLGLIDGTYVWTLGGSDDTVTMTIDTSVIPLPPGLALALAGLGALTVLRRRKS